MSGFQAWGRRYPNEDTLLNKGGRVIIDPGASEYLSGLLVGALDLLGGLSGCPESVQHFGNGFLNLVPHDHPVS